MQFEPPATPRPARLQFWLRPFLEPAMARHAFLYALLCALSAGSLSPASATPVPTPAPTTCPALVASLGPGGDVLPRAECESIRALDLCRVYTALADPQCRVTCAGCVEETASPTAAPIGCERMAIEFPDMIGSASCRAAPNFQALCQSDTVFHNACRFTCSGCWTRAPSRMPTSSEPTAAPSYSPASSAPTVAPSVPPTTSEPSVSPTSSCAARSLCGTHDTDHDANTWNCAIGVDAGGTVVCTFETNSGSCAALGGIEICTDFPTAAPSGQPSPSPSPLPTTLTPTVFPTPGICLVNVHGDAQCALLVADAAGIGLTACHDPETKRICGKTCCDTRAPTAAPTTSPSGSSPTISPTLSPSSSPTPAPSVVPTISPSGSTPTVSPTTSDPTASPTTSDPTVSPTLSPSSSPTEERCSDNVELIFLLDESSSIDDANWGNALNFVKEVTVRYELGRALECGLGGNFSQACTYTGDWQTKVALATFSGAANRGADDDGTHPHAMVHFDLDQYSNPNDIFAAIDAIPHAGGATYTDRGLALVHTDVLPAARPVSSGVARILIVITDGAYTPGHNPAGVAEALRNNGATIFTVVVGAAGVATVEDMSTSISGSLSQTYAFDTYSDLDTFPAFEELHLATCIHAACGPDLVEDCQHLAGSEWANGEWPGCIDPTVAASCPSTCCRHNVTAPTTAPTAAPTTLAPTDVPTTVPTTGACSTDVAGELACNATIFHYNHILGRSACDEPEVQSLCEKSCCLLPVPTAAPTATPSSPPTALPTMSEPSASPTALPTTSEPTVLPTASPSSATPTATPSTSPSSSPTITTCDRDLDLVFLLDESSSLTGTTATPAWFAMLDFVKDVSAQFKVGREYVCGSTPGSACAFEGTWQTKVAVATFSSPNLRPDNTIRSAFTHVRFEDNTNLQDFQSAVDQIRPMPGATFTDAGLELVRSEIIPECRSNSAGAARVVVIMTDSMFTAGHNPASIAAALRNDNRTTILGIAVGAARPEIVAAMVKTSITGSLDQTFISRTHEELNAVIFEPAHESICDHAICGLDSVNNCVSESLAGADRTGCYNDAVHQQCSATCCSFQFASTSTRSPSGSPSEAPSPTPTTLPTVFPTVTPTKNPTMSPTTTPTTNKCSSDDAGYEACQLTIHHFNSHRGSNACAEPEVANLCKRSCCLRPVPTAAPTGAPSASPTASPTVSNPTNNPTATPTVSLPTTSPTTSPTTLAPTAQPTMLPTTSGPTLSPTPSPSNSPTIYRCSDDLDLMILIDESSSVESGAWDETLAFVRNVTRRFNVGRDLVCGAAPGSACAYLGPWRTQVGVATFSSPNLRPDGSIRSAYTHIQLGEHDNIGDFQAAFDEIPQKPGATYTDDGFELIQSEMMPHVRGPAAGIQRVILVISDTMFSDNHDPSVIAASLRHDNNTKIVGLALGNSTSDLTELAAAMAQTLSVSDTDGIMDRTYSAFANDLGQTTDFMVHQVCELATCGADTIQNCPVLIDIFGGCGETMAWGILADRCSHTCCGWSPAASIEPTEDVTTTTTTPQPMVQVSNDGLSDGCVTKTDTISGICDASMCCTHEATIMALVVDNCQATCCGVTCPSTAPATQDCAAITCGADCSGACGWSTNSGVCKLGGRTSSSELSMGSGCPVAVDTAPAPQDCAAITCGADCSGACGWSTSRGVCKLGGRTSSSERTMGDCDTIAAVPAPPQALTSNQQCKEIRCGADCTGPCGWSSNKMKCLLGGRTTSSEQIMGQC